MKKIIRHACTLVTCDSKNGLFGAFEALRLSSATLRYELTKAGDRAAPPDDHMLCLLCDQLIWHMKIELSIKEEEHSIHVHRLMLTCRASHCVTVTLEPHQGDVLVCAEVGSSTVSETYGSA